MFQNISGKEETFIKVKGKICVSSYQSENTLDSAMERCNLDEDCNMFYNPDCSNKGPFRLCNSTSNILDSDVGNCAYSKIKEEGNYHTTVHSFSLKFNTRLLIY